MVLVVSKTEALIEKGEKRKRWMNVGLQSPAAAAALEGNNEPEACMYRALCGLARLLWPCRKTFIKLQSRGKQKEGDVGFMAGFTVLSLHSHITMEQVFFSFYTKKNNGRYFIFFITVNVQRFLLMIGVMTMTWMLKSKKNVQQC